MADLPEVALEAAQFAQRQVDVGKLVAELLVEFFLEVAGTHVVDHRRLRINRVHSLAITTSDHIARAASRC